MAPIYESRDEFKAIVDRIGLVAALEGAAQYLYDEKELAAAVSVNQAIGHLEDK